MMQMSRRRFLRTGAMGAAALAGMCGMLPIAALADPLGLPVGIQLFTVREQLAKDFDGTLRQVAAAGYTEVEAAGYYKHTAQQVKQALQSAGLRCPSAHYSMQQLHGDSLQKEIEFAHQLGLNYMICPFPGVADPSRLKPTKGNFMASINHFINSITLDDWKWNAEQFNKIGEQTRKAGIQFGYHNHDLEFRTFGNTTGYDVILQRTDPKLVTLEMDCGWVEVAGLNPITFLEKYPTRFSMLHVKDETVISPPQYTPFHPKGSSIELGRGKIDYKPIFAAAKKAGHVRHYFVEQEEFPDLPTMQAIRIDADYLHHLSV